MYWEGSMYDIRKFLDLHPGGRDILESHRNQDITQVMKNETIHEHSALAYEYLSKLKMHKPISELRQDILNSKKRFVLDLERPLLCQIWNNKHVTREQYLQRIHEPILSRKSYRLFESDYLEFLSKTPWWVVPTFWIPIIAILLASSYMANLSVSSVVFYFTMGMLCWTFIEYMFHRFIFHSDDYLPRHRYFYTLHFLIHGVHHFMPMDPYRLVMPPALFVQLTMLVVPILNVLIKTAEIRNCFLGGIFAGYVVYDLMHYYLHHAVVSTSYMKELKKYHMDHHFKSSKVGFGVTSKFWDLVWKS